MTMWSEYAETTASPSIGVTHQSWQVGYYQVITVNFYFVFKFEFVKVN